MPERDDVDARAAALVTLRSSSAKRYGGSCSMRCDGLITGRSSPATNSAENTPSQTCSTGPDSRTARSSDDLDDQVASVGVYRHGAPARPATTAATAAALDPEPDESVSPAPRSQTRIRISPSATGR